MAFYVDVTRADGTSQRFPIEEAEVMLGRSVNVHIPLPNETQVDLEHVLFAPQGRKGCWVSCAESVIHPLTFNGEAFHRGIVPWGSQLEIGSLKMTLNSGHSHRVTVPKIAPKVIATVVFVVGFIIWGYLQTSRGGATSAHKLDTPELFVEVSSCRSSNKPLAAAIRAEHAGHSRGDRYAYEPNDGVRAVRDYEEAALCYLAADQHESAERVAVYKERLQARIASDYAAARTRLFQAYESQRWSTVLVEARKLISLTSDIDSDQSTFVAWLHQTRRRAATKVTHGE